MSQSTPTPDTTARTETAETVTVPRELTPIMRLRLRKLIGKGGPADMDDAWAHFLAAAPALASPHHPVGVIEAIARRLEQEADMLPCDEDAAVTRSNARLIRADFSYDDAERLATLSHPPAQDAPGAVKALDTDRVERLKAAVEGECEGLAITDEQAVAILRYVDEAAREKAEQVAAGLREAGETLDDRLTEYATGIECEEDAREFDGHVMPALARFRAALRASTEEGKTATPSVKDEEAGRG